MKEEGFFSCFPAVLARRGTGPSLLVLQHWLGQHSEAGPDDDKGMSEPDLKCMSVGQLTLPLACPRVLRHRVRALVTMAFRKAVHRVMRSGKLALPLTNCSTWKSRPLEYFV